EEPDRLLPAAHLDSALLATARAERRGVLRGPEVEARETVGGAETGGDLREQRVEAIARRTGGCVAPQRVGRGVGVEVSNDASFGVDVIARVAGATALGRDDDDAVRRVGAIERSR